mmetsp:Transcript_68204/g.192277  ORF Transcript_68204/g.192277 Transcript_68204/m.192277 type:complete len:319 (-) Transcript_68204:54-1010(-)
MCQGRETKRSVGVLLRLCVYFRSSPRCCTVIAWFRVAGFLMALPRLRLLLLLLLLLLLIVPQGLCSSGPAAGLGALHGGHRLTPRHAGCAYRALHFGAAFWLSVRLIARPLLLRFAATLACNRRVPLLPTRPPVVEDLLLDLAADRGAPRAEEGVGLGLLPLVPDGHCGTIIAIALLPAVRPSPARGLGDQRPRRLAPALAEPHGLQPRPGRGQLLQRLDAPALRGLVRGGVAAGVAGLHVGPGPEQEAHDLAVPARARRVQRGPARDVLRIDAHAAPHQRGLHPREVAAVGVAPDVARQRGVVLAGLGHGAPEWARQ